MKIFGDDKDMANTNIKRMQPNPYSDSLDKFTTNPLTDIAIQRSYERIKPDEDVIKVLWLNKISLLKRYLGKGYNLDEFIKYLDNRFEDSSCIEESLYRIKYNILNKPVCPTCGKPLPFLNMKGGKFKKICGYKCSNSNPQKIQKTID